MKKIFFLFLLFAPFIAFCMDTYKSKGIQIEYSIQIENDSLVNFHFLPFKKVITLHQGEALLQDHVYWGDVQLFYYDLDINFIYYSYDWYNPKQTLLKRKWIEKGRLLDVGTDKRQIAGVDCIAKRIVKGPDTLTVFTTETFGLSFCEMGDVGGVAMSYEVMSQGYKIKYTATRVTNVLLADGQLADIASYNVKEQAWRYKKVQRSQKRFNRWLSNVNRKMLGRKAPPFRVWDLEGNVIKHKHYLGKITTLYIGPVGTRASLFEIPYLNRVVNIYEKDEDVAFIGLINESAEKYNRLMHNRSFKYLICPSSYFLAERYKAPWQPLHVVIDQAGNIADYFYGNHLDTPKRLVETIERLKRE